MILSHTAHREGRLSSFLLGELRLSSGLMNRLKWGDGIRVDGLPRHTDYHVLPGSTITVCFDEEAPQYPAQDGPLDILYEDDWLLVVDKPSGMLIHPSRAKNEGTLANYVAGYYQKTGEKSAFHPMTRLDRDTFGVVVLAKNAYCHALLQTSQVEKTYQAMVFGGPEADSGRIEAPIARRPAPSLLRYVDDSGKPCITRYRVVQRGQLCTILELEPITGRTHQLRVHCSYEGFPIVGDPQYGSAASMAFSAELGVRSQLLCAKKVTLCHPVTEKKLELSSHMGISETDLR